MKKFALVASVLVFVCLCVYGFYSSSAADKQSKEAAGQNTASSKQDKTKPQNAALVNGKPIPMSDYQAGIDQLHRQISMTGRQVDEKEMSELKRRVIDNLVGRELMRQEIKKKGLKADDAEVDTQIAAMKSNRSPEEFADLLKQHNMTEQSLKEQYGTQLTMKKLVETELGPKITVTDAEMKSFYDANPESFKINEMVRASHILVKVEKTATAEEKAKALEKIKSVQKRLKGGEDFAQVAKEVSDCPSKANGGDLNFFEKGRMVPAFENAAFALKPGDTSDIVETEFGYHIIRVTDKKPARTISFDEAKPRIAQYLKNQKMSEEFPKYIETLKSKADIKILVKE